MSINNYTNMDYRYNPYNPPKRERDYERESNLKTYVVLILIGLYALTKILGTNSSSDNISVIEHSDYLDYRR